MIKKLLSVLLLIGFGNVAAQNLHTHSNAVSIENEANSTTGWTGTAVISSVSEGPQSGNFSIQAVSTNNNGRELRYTFNAVVGVDYIIRIWAKEGPEVSPNNEPAFANWTGMNGFSTTPIVGTTWSEYVFNVTATSTTPVIRVYTSLYAQRLIAGNTVTIDSVSIIAEGSDTEAPSAVTNLNSSNLTFSSVDLTWNASTDNVGVVNYEVFQDGVSIANTGTSTNFGVTGLSANSSYDFTVFAEDAAGNVSASSNILTVNTPNLVDTQAPTSVTDLASSNTTATGTSLTWSASTDNVGVTNYEVFQDGISIANTGTVTTFNVTGLTSSTSYDFTVFAEDAAGNVSSAGNTETVTTLAPPDTQAPTAVTDLASSNTTDTGTSLTWSASTDNVGVTNYEVLQDGVSIANTGTSTSFNVTGLAPSTEYDFTVFAEDAAGNVSAAGNTETVTTTGTVDTEAPTAVTDLNASGTTSSGTSLSWSASTDNIGVTNYQVFQNGVVIANTGTSTNFNVTGLTPDTSYGFTVLAQDAANNVSAAGNTVNVTSLIGSGVVTYTSENANLDTVDWTARDLFANRNIGIGTTDTQGHRLAVAGSVIAEGVKVELQGNWPDFVFTEEFELMELEQVRKFIREHGHLPNIPSAKKVAEDGIDLGKMNANLLQKIEELTLYILSQEDEINKLKEENTKIMDILNRLERLENRQ